MIKPSAATLRIVVAVLFASTLFATSRVNTLAHRSQASLPILREDYLTAVTSWYSTLDPATTESTNEAETEQMMYNGLVQFLPPAKTNGQAKIVLDLADKMTVSKDKKTYTFHIRNNARFANGDPVTAQDVVFSITRAANKDTAPNETGIYDALIKGLLDYTAGKSNKISGLKVVNAKTIAITIIHPAAYFVSAFSYSVNYVLDHKVLAGHKPGDLTTDCHLHQGTGQFKPVCQNNSSDVTSFYKGGSTPTLTLVPNPRYWGHKAKIKVVVPNIPSADTGYNLYKAGQMDVMSISPVSEIPKWKGKKDFLTYASTIVVWLRMDVTTAPFNNIHCRLAVAHAIDRDTIANKIIPGSVIPYYTVVPPGYLGYYNAKKTLNKKGGTPWYSPSLAKKELAQCPGGINNVDWPYRATTADARRIRDATVSMLDQVGIKVKVRDITSPESSKQFSTPLHATGAKMFRSGWQQDYPDPQDYVTLLLKPGGQYEITGWKNATFTSLVNKADVANSQKARAALYIKAQKLAISQAIWVPYYVSINNILVKPYVHGLIGSTAAADPTPKNNDWSNVTIGKH